MLPTPSQISVRRTSSYDKGTIYAAVRSCLEPFGGMAAFVKPNQSVLLKPNLLGPFTPDKAVTTHPSVVRAVAQLVLEAGGKPRLGDSPGVVSLSRAIHSCGLKTVVDELGIATADFETPWETVTADGRVVRKLTLVRALQQADVVISLPKLKTHVQMGLTGALKNQFGFVPGTQKAQWHLRLRDRAWLASLILEINRIARPAIAILDGVVAMEGAGPSAGRPRFLGAMIAGTDLAAIDTVACHLIGLEPSKLPLLRAASLTGYGATDLANIEILGDDWRSLRCIDFDLVRELDDPIRVARIPQFVLRWLSHSGVAHPRVQHSACNQCGICTQGCPIDPPAIHPNGSNSCAVDDDRCIRCYCCHEFCPSHAIALRRPWLAHLLPHKTA